MEGKANLFKQFADLDVFDLEVGSENPDDVIKFCQLLEPTVGGINLEDIRAPDCFYIEETLRKTLKIPVFHDDQHGTAIISGAALLNALEIVGKDIGDDQGRVLRRRRRRDLHRRALRAARREAREHHSVRSRRRDLQGPHGRHGSVQGALRSARRRRARSPTRWSAPTSSSDCQSPARSRARWSRRWRRSPIIFALANPVPEILPDEVRAVRDDAIIATGRSDYPNQVNNVLGFPFIFRGALDVRATEDERGDEDGGDARARAAREGGRARQRRRGCTACAT